MMEIHFFVGKHLAVMTEDSVVYVANQEGFTSALKRHLIHDGHLIDVVLSQADYEMDDENKIGDLIGISESSVYIWDPLQGGEPVGLRFEEITNDKISSVVSMSNELCIIGKIYAFKRYDQFALNTSCLWGSIGSNITPAVV